jgi:predicted ATPase
MITRLEIDGFKSFADFAIDLTPFHVIIGTNASGKSNLCDALEFFRQVWIARDPYAGVRAVRGSDVGLFRQRGDGTRADTMRIVVWLTVRAREQDMQVRFQLDVGWSLDDVGERVLDASFSHEFVDSAAIDDTVRFETIEQAGELIRRLRVFQWEDRALREPSLLGDATDLEPNGGNLPGYLRRIFLRTRSENWPTGVLSDIRVDFANVVREVFSFDVVDDEERRDVRVTFSDKNGPGFSAELASAGTLRVLATLAALHNPFKIDQTFVFEEPENGVYPERLRDLLRTMRSLTSDLERDDRDLPLRQVLVTSHSPVVLDVVPHHEITLLDTVTLVSDGTASRIARGRSLGYTDVNRELGEPVRRVSENDLRGFRTGRGEAAVR